tara:strand:+ start:159 stop:329 length:171 start_codon:yes stop_codon:yes gene_type:complete
LKKLSESNSEFIDFSIEDIEKFKNIIDNDISFFTENGIIDYNLKMVIELNDPANLK